MDENKDNKIDFKKLPEPVVNNLPQILYICGVALQLYCKMDSLDETDQTPSEETGDNSENQSKPMES